MSEENIFGVKNKKNYSFDGQRRPLDIDGYIITLDCIIKNNMIISRIRVSS
jgi:hypothetical protein